MKLKKMLRISASVLALAATLTCMPQTATWTPVSAKGELDASLEEAVVLMVDTPTAFVGGSKTSVDPMNKKVVPVIVNDRTLVPVRFIAESFGATVDWDGSRDLVTVQIGEDTIQLVLNSQEMTVNEQTVLLDVPATTIEDRTMIPLRAMAEAIGKKVFWDDRGLIVISDTEGLIDGKEDLISKTIAAFSSDWESVIQHADEVAHGMQTFYENSKREKFVIENQSMKLVHGLATQRKNIQSIENSKGQTYLTDAMENVVEDAAGNVYSDGLSEYDGRINIYRLGTYYNDVHILDMQPQNISSAGSGQQEVGTVNLNGAWKGNMTTPPVMENNALTFTITDKKDPYISLRDFTIPLGNTDAVEFRMKYTGTAGKGRVYYTTDVNPKFSEEQAASFDIITDGEYHTYKVNLKSDLLTGSLTGIRFDINSGEVEAKAMFESIVLVSSGDSAVSMKTERIYHTFPDKLHVENVFYATEDLNVKELYVETKWKKSEVSAIQIKDNGAIIDGGQLTKSETVEYVAAQTKAGTFGLIFPNTTPKTSVSVSEESDCWVIRQYAPVSGSVKNKDKIRIGTRLFTDENGGFDSINQAAQLERNPLNEQQIKLLDVQEPEKFEGYDPYNGTYVFYTEGSNFNEAYYDQPQKQPKVKVAIQNDDAQRDVYIKVRSDAGALECAVVLDENENLLPIQVAVNKNFKGENEEPFYAEGDTAYAESYFPLSLNPRQNVEFTNLHLYQNWGKYPLKQISGVRFFQPYYHLSTGVTETNCWVPFYVDNTGFILPDFRARSAKMWTTQPQFDSAGTNKILEYTDKNGQFSRGENTSASVPSSGPVYSDLNLGFTTYDGKLDYTIRSVEFPQTDENRTFVTLEIDVKDTLEISEADKNFSLFTSLSRGQTYSKMGYLDQNNQPKELTFEEGKEETVVLGSEMPYWAVYDFTGKDKDKGTNVAVLVQNADITIGGQKYNGGFAAYSSLNGGVNTNKLTLAQKDVILRKGDKFVVDLILLPFGSDDTKDDSIVQNMRQTDGFNRLKATAATGTVTDDRIVPTMIAQNGNAEFTLSGGYNNVVCKVEGFSDYTKPTLYKKVNGNWEIVDNSVKGYDGYQAYVCEDGSYGFAWVVETTGEPIELKVEQ